jgi:uncharacterized protein (DUF885 family)/heat shock protein HslJ
MTRLTPFRFLAAGVLTMASATPGRAADPTLADLGGKEWVLRSWASGEDAPPKPEVTLEYKDGRFAGRSGCNRYFASVTPGGRPGDIVIGPAGGTRMACPSDVMAVEARFLKQLGAVTRFGLPDGRLALDWKDGAAVATMLFDARHPPILGGKETGKAMSYQEQAEAIIAGRGKQPEGERLRQLFAADWDYGMRESPEAATWTGYPGQNDRWTDRSLEALERRERELEIPARVLATIDRARLSPADQVSHDLFKHNLDEALEARRFKGEYMPVSQMGGPQQDLAQVLALSPHATVKDYEDMLARLRAAPTVIDQTIVLMRTGLDKGLTPPRVTLRNVAPQILNQVVDDPLKSPLLGAFTRFPPSVPAADQDRLRTQAAETYRSAVAPAFKRLHAFFVDEYLPKTRETISLGALPDGEAWYAWNVRHYTTTNLTPRQIHDLGLSEVKRIRAEMDAVIAQAGFKGTFKEFLAFLRTDPRFFFEKPEDLLAAYRDIAKRADPELVRMFGRLPRLPYGVVPVPSYAEKSQTTAYYEPGSLANGRPGHFFANTYDLRSRPKWEMEALTLHEAVPGHHLQIALAQEQADVPEFRKHALFTAYVEGWGLYAESLGGEMGFYKDPYARFGQLTYEMWRAVRLVVDTGMHALGWTRDQAIRFFQENAGKAEHDIVVEVDRYIVWPGQALAYKVGELKIKELRAKAQRRLGARFDVRAFHDVVLESGAVPLDVLEARVDRWMEATADSAR